MTQTVPSLGFGLGLRIPHYAHIFEHWPQMGWFEIISENFMETDGLPKRNLARFREHYPIVMHGVGLSIGTVDPLSSDYLAKLKALADWLEPPLVSDHLCWTGVAHRNSHDLLPVPYTEEALNHIVERLDAVQTYLGRPIALENPSTYLQFSTSHIPEAEFLAEMSKRSGCLLLLDVNNIYVSCYNHHQSVAHYLDALPYDRIAQIHLSGHTNKGDYIIDTHDEPVIDAVWQIYSEVLSRAGRLPNTMIEWDDQIPEWAVMVAELEKAKQIADKRLPSQDLPDFSAANGDNQTVSPLPLKAIQQQMMEAILLGDSSIHAQIAPAISRTSEQQMTVYQDAYRIRLCRIVRNEYPVLCHALGEKMAEGLIESMVDQVPSTRFNIGRYSSLLPDFLKSHALGTPFLLALAQMEDSITRIADMPETDPLSPEMLEGMTPEQLMTEPLHLRNALELWAFSYPVNRYFRRFKEDQSPEIPGEETSYLAIFRHEDTVWRLDLDEGEYLLLKLLRDKIAVGEALAMVAAQAGQDEAALMMNISQWFSKWMRNGLLAAAPKTAYQQRKIAS